MTIIITLKDKQQVPFLNVPFYETTMENIFIVYGENGKRHSATYSFNNIHSVEILN